MSKRKKIVWIVLSLFLIFGIIAGYRIFEIAFSPNVQIPESEAYFFIPTNADLAFIATKFNENSILENVNTFLFVANRKHYGNHIKPGRYKIYDGMSNVALVNLLRSGNQTPMMVTFNNVRTLQDLSGKIAKYFETDSQTFVSYFDTTTFFKTHQLNNEQRMTLFLPDSYEFKWNTNPKQFCERMKSEHDLFWNAERNKKLKEINLSEKEVYTLASIVYSETKMSDEAARVAGVYINRLVKNIPLQADPTIIFAIGDFTKTRVLFADLQIQSPYNTYLNTGLPPGPICMPPKKYIDAVLNFEKHSYIYFCAREDFSGYSNFASTLSEHNINASRYQKALNKLQQKKKMKNQ